MSDSIKIRLLRFSSMNESSAIVTASFKMQVQSFIVMPMDIEISYCSNVGQMMARSITATLESGDIV